MRTEFGEFSIYEVIYGVNGASMDKLPMQNTDAGSAYVSPSGVKFSATPLMQ